MESNILLNELKVEIGNKKVLSVLINTFTFDPVFFENYIMPVFVDEEFGENEIHNKIKWRRLVSEKKIPPISVFCDFYAKDQTKAPTLGYDIQCIKMPSAKGSICNFHPKHLFILLEDEYKDRKLLLITGSGNMTISGWCDNIEAFSFETILENKRYSNSRNVYQEYISYVNEFSELNEFSNAENLINEYLKRYEYGLDTDDDNYFNSFNLSFKEYVSDIIDKYEMTEVEIVSPYFSKDNKNIEWLQSKGIETIKCLIPTLRNNEINLLEDDFLKIQTTGIEWCKWKDNNLNKEERNLHAKIYKFYNSEICITIIGSVNFTNPAWQQIPINDKTNKANLETAYLYSSDKKDRILSVIKNFNRNDYYFLNKDSVEENILLEGFNRDAPDISFTIDWLNKELIVKNKDKKRDWFFFNIFDKEKIETAKYSIENLTKHFSRNSLIRISNKAETELYSYYANQINIENKPFGYRISANTVLNFWNFFDDKFKRDKLLEKLTNEATNESGVINEEKLLKKQSLLNEMAIHFSALVKLEKYLFKDLKTIKETEYHFKELNYYLLSENIDTLPFYLKDISKSIKNKSFRWMILQICILNIYDKDSKWKTIKRLDAKVKRKFKNAIKIKVEALKVEANSIYKDIKGLDRKKAEWVIDQLKKNYE